MANPSAFDHDKLYQKDEISSDDDVDFEDKEDDVSLDIFSEENKKLTMNDFVLESITTKALKAKYTKIGSKKQENWTPNKMNIRLLLSLSPDRVYTVEDLDSKKVLNRALQILFYAQYKQRK
ncbi:hypothetical protein MMC29_005948 [Sticta canariensis]|nr:hypothetical protein [Sticta canariensis]